MASAHDNDNSSKGTGTVAMTSRTVLDHDVVNDHVAIDTVKVSFDVTGALSGKAVAIERDVLRNVTTSAGTTSTVTTFHGRGNFTGTLTGITGTGSLVVRYEGRNNGTFTRGNFVIGHGSDALVGVHGEGKFSGSSVANVESGHPPALNYTLHWQVAHPEGPQAEDKDHDHDDNSNDD